MRKDIIIFLILFWLHGNVNGQNSRMATLNKYGLGPVQLGENINDIGGFVSIKEFSQRANYLAYKNPDSIYAYEKLDELVDDSYLSNVIENVFVGIAPDSTIKRIFIHIKKEHVSDSVFNEMAKVFGGQSSIGSFSADQSSPRRYYIWNTSYNVQAFYYYGESEIDPIPEIGFLFIDELDETMDKYKLIKRTWKK